MRVKILLAIILAAVTSLQRQAFAASESAERSFADRSQLGLTRYFVLHAEEGLWRVEQFEAREGQLQRFSGRKSFNSSADAVAEIRKLSPHSEEISVESMEADGTPPGPVTELPGRVVWKVENAWDWNWELRYAAWIQENVKPDFFQKYKIGVDCADVVFAARWIFSRIHHLPAVSSLAATGALFSQESVIKEWGQLPQAEEWHQDQLFMAALKYVLDNTYTHTLMRDSYPIAIVKEALLPGTNHLNLIETSGHTYLVSALELSENSAEPIQVMYSTVPAEARILAVGGFWDSHQPSEGRGGFIRFRWPVRDGDKWTLRAAEQMPFFSREQYTRDFLGNFRSFAEAVAIKLNPHLDFKARLQKAISNLVDRIKSRMEVVEKSEKICAQGDCKPGTANYENWSTPNRDRGLGETMLAIQEYVDRLGDNIPELYDIWSKSLEAPVIRLDGVDYSLGAVIFAWQTSSYSSEPWEPSDVRWGLSGPAFVTSIRLRFKKWLDERALKIDTQGTACHSASSCAAGTAEWQSWQTYDLDAKIRALALRSGAFCDYAPDAHCESFISAFNTEAINVAGRSKTLNEWIEISPWLNSAPTQGKEERWGLLKSKYKNRLSAIGEKVTISKNGWALGVSSDRQSASVVENLFTGEKVRASPGFSFTVLDADSGLAGLEKAGVGSKDILIARLEDRSIALHVRASPSASFSWFAHSRIALSEKHSLRIYDCSRNPCAMERAYQTDRKTKLGDSSRQGVFLILTSNHSYSIVDGRNARLKNYRLRWTSERYLPDTVELETQDYFGGMAVDCHSTDNCDPRQYFVRKSDGEVIFPDYSEGTEYLLHVSSTGRWGILAQLYDADRRLSFVELDADLKVKGKTVLGKKSADPRSRVCSIPEAVFLIVEDAQAKKHYYRFTDEGVAEAALLSDEIEPLSGCGNEAVFKTTSGERLRRWGEETPRFESARIDFLQPEPEEQGIRWIMSSPVKDFTGAELYDLKAETRTPVLTGSWVHLDQAGVRSGHIVGFESGRLLWFR